MPDDTNGSAVDTAMLCGMRDSPFSRLPPELRNSIWDFVLHDTWTSANIALFRPRHKDRIGQHRFALLQTCKTIKHEAQGFAWQGARVVVHHSDFCYPKNDIYDYLTHEGLELKRAKWQVAEVTGQLKRRLAGIVELDCQQTETGLTARRFKCVIDIAQHYATAELLPKLTAVRRLRVTGNYTYATHCTALGLVRKILFATPDSLDQARQHLQNIRMLLPHITETLIQPWHESEVEPPISWKVEGSKYSKSPGRCGSYEADDDQRRAE